MENLGFGVVEVPAGHSEIEEVSACVTINPKVPAGLDRRFASVAALDSWVALKVLG